MLNSKQIVQLDNARKVFSRPEYRNDMDLYEFLSSKGFHPDETIYEFNRIVEAIAEYQGLSDK